MEQEVRRLIEQKGPQTGSELLENLREKSFSLWKTCHLSSHLLVRSTGTRYLRLDRMVEGYARLSPSILREFMTYTVVGLAGDEGALQERVEKIQRHVEYVSRSKLALARGIVGHIHNRLEDSWPKEARICIILAGDIVYGMAHDVPRTERSLGKLVNGSDIDMIVVAEDSVPEDFLRELDQTIYREKYLNLISPSAREEIDYVVKNMDRVREQLRFDTFKRMVACKILWEGVLLFGSQSLFQEIQAMLVQNGVLERLRDMQKKAERFRREAHRHLLESSMTSLRKEDLRLFYTTEESEEFE